MDEAVLLLSLRRPHRKEITLTDQDLRRTAAYHEAGHAVMIYLLGSQIRYICIDRDGGVTDYIEPLGYEQYILDKVSGVVGAEAGFKDRSDEFNGVLRNAFERTSFNANNPSIGFILSRIVSH